MSRFHCNSNVDSTLFGHECLAAALAARGDEFVEEYADGINQLTSWHIARATGQAENVNYMNQKLRRAILLLESATASPTAEDSK